MDGPSVQRFVSLTGPLAPKVADCRSAAMLIKSALRDLLSVSYDMKTILLTGSLRSPPPIRPRRTSTYAGGRIKHREASFVTQRIAKNKVPHRGEGGGASHQKGCISSPAGRLYGFIQTGAFYNLEAPTTPLAPKGETTHYDLCVASAPSSTVVTDSLDFQVADAPLQIQFA